MSDEKYNFFLAQNRMKQKYTNKYIKDQDMMTLMNSEVAIFAFDSVDSGTVVEFMLAKQLDIPAVIVRTDFRGGSGEESNDAGNNKWNLMV